MLFFYVLLGNTKKKGMILVNLMRIKTQRSKIQKNRNNTEIKLRAFAFMSVEELFSDLSTTKDGLTSTEAENRLDEFGKNIITTSNKNTTLHRLREAVVNPFNIILLFIAVITYFTDVVSSSQPDYLTVTIILSMVFLSSLVAFVQSQRSNAAAVKLLKMISNKAEVKRDGKPVEIMIDEVIPGDIVRLSAGDMLPADVRFLTAKDIFVAQAALTGESNPVEKFIDVGNKPGDGITDLRNIGFMGNWIDAYIQRLGHLFNAYYDVQPVHPTLRKLFKCCHTDYHPQYLGSTFTDLQQFSIAQVALHRIIT